jgi:L-ribulose-5-phosphate 3-epimerase
MKINNILLIGSPKFCFMKQSRRKFISTITVAGTAIPFTTNLESFLGATVENRYPINLFSKPLDSFDFNFVCECVVKAGLKGLDLTVRPGGKVEPSAVETNLPKLIEEARKFNLTTEMIVTGIVSAEDGNTERILKAASSSGVKFYRLGWFEYDNNTAVWDTLQKYRTRLTGIAELNKKYKIHGGYQNHVGNKVGAPVWDLHELLRDFPPEIIGSQYDVRHGMVEGTDIWTIGMRLIARHIKTLAMKDFIWQIEGGKPQPVTVPMGEGMIDWDLFFQMVKKLGIIAPLTLHIEYPLLEKGEEKLALAKQQEIIVRKIKKDVDFINSYLKKYQLV